jgi:structural maintenance of chromosome 3 (chondroitin sulfate proteoglycan 6)
LENAIFQLEGEKNKLENLLSNNLTKKRDRLMADMQEASLDEKRQKLNKLRDELKSVDERLGDMKGQSKSSYLFYLFILLT